MIVRWEDLFERGAGGTYADGVPAEPAALQSLLCDSALHRVLVTGRSSILDYGTATRSFPANLWNALVVRDRHCRFPGCDRASPMCHGHHVVPFEQRGPTRLANCVLLCHRHHRVIHRRGWRVLGTSGPPAGTKRRGKPRHLRAAALSLRFATAHPQHPRRFVMAGSMDAFVAEAADRPVVEFQPVPG